MGLFSPPILIYRSDMKTLTILLTLCASTSVLAETFDLPSEHFGVIGSMRTVQSTYEDTLLDIARRANIGQNQMERVNPDVDRWMPGEGTVITIPSHFVLPRAQRKGVVLNLPEMRMYYFPPKKAGAAGASADLSNQYRSQGLGDPTGHDDDHQQKERPLLAPPRVDSPRTCGEGGSFAKGSSCGTG